MTEFVEGRKEDFLKIIFLVRKEKISTAVMVKKILPNTNMVFFVFSIISKYRVNKWSNNRALSEN